MQKKSVLILFLILSISFAIAQNSSNSGTQSNQQSQDIISKAYQCLQNQVDSKDSKSISLQEAVFGALALGSNSKLVSVIEGKSVGGNHWKESSSEIKDTSQVAIAYDRIGKNTDNIKSWILSKRQSAADLTWHLEIDIDNHESSQCTVSYNNNRNTITVNDDMTLSGNPGSCFAISSGNFWLKVSNTCIDNNYTISCDKDFTTSTLYQRTGSSTVFVSPAAHSGSALGTTTETINSKCLSSSSSSCDYEGTLWGALALDKMGENINGYLPYLVALSESNQKFLPSSFIHILTQGQDQYSQIVESQQQGKFWQAPNTPYNRYYDSALAILSLQQSNSVEAQNSMSYFESITTPEGCWNNNNIRDTGFLLYAGWQKVVSSEGSGGSAQTCESAGKSCTSLFTCSDLGGEALEDYLCPGTKVCCSKSAPTVSCTAQNGIVCSSTQSCTGTTVSSTEGSCCLGSCEAIPQSSECEIAGGSCYPSCLENEEQISASCGGSSNICCKTSSTSSNSSSSGLWITLLVILIVLVIAGILMRNKIKMLLFKSRNSVKGSSDRPSRLGPGMPPRSPPFPPSRGPIPYPRARPVVLNSQSPIGKPSGRDKEMEETMAKLKEMSK